MSSNSFQVHLMSQVAVVGLDPLTGPTCIDIDILIPHLVDLWHDMKRRPIWQTKITCEYTWTHPTRLGLSFVSQLKNERERETEMIELVGMLSQTRDA